MKLSEYDLVVIGSGPAGQKGAIAAAKARKRVAIIDRTVMIGGVSVHTGTIPSKTVREAIFQLTGSAVKTLYGNGSRGRVDISVLDVLGQRATEIIHIGQAVLFYGGSVEYFRDMVFNYPTLAEAYKVAALDGLNKL
jgi:pyruvate/2-oxoglutarate dehydrogenase complex dihydrolipoamide dehydrogenase (E3) component